MNQDSMLNSLPTPAVLVDRDRLDSNIQSLQAAADAHAIELRPHLKTHKLVEVARRQLAAGARGLTCAKIGEAEAILPCGVRDLFIAHSLVDPRQAPRLAALAEKLDTLRLAVTSEAQADALLRLAALTGRRFPVLLAVDTGLHREGVRSVAEAQRVAGILGRSQHVELTGFYTHEGHLYGVPPDQQRAQVEGMLETLNQVRDAIDPSLAVWPGCSASVRHVLAAARSRVQAVRPGAYVFGDLFLTTMTGMMRSRDAALHVLATVVDLPEPGLALIDAGSKTFSSDRTPEGLFAVAADGRDLSVVRVNEEHGYVRGADTDKLTVGERLAFIPAHVCPVVNLTDEVTVVAAGAVVDTWRVVARGKTR